MFFILSKTLGVISIPSHALALLAFFGGLLLLEHYLREQPPLGQPQRLEPKMV